MHSSLCRNFNSLFFIYPSFNLTMNRFLTWLMHFYMTLNIVEHLLTGQPVSQGQGGGGLVFVEISIAFFLFTLLSI